MKNTMEYIIDFAKRVLAIPSPSGYTEQVIRFCQEEATKLGYHTELSKKGNLIIHVKGKTDFKLGLSGHVDTLGAMVRSITASGDLKFTSIGGPIWPTLDGEFCTIHTRSGKDYTGTFLSVSPSSHINKDALTMERSPEKMAVRIDEVVESANDVKKLGIAPGDFIFFDPKTTVTPSGYIKSRFLDDKISVSVLFGLLAHLARTKLIPAQTLTIIISTYVEVGHGASFVPELDELIAVDMGCIGEDLSCNERMVSICCKDSGGPYDYKIVSKLANLAKDNALDFATDIYPFYGSDVTAALHGGNDLRGGLIGPGVHASHGMERTHIKALENTLKLLLLYLEG